MSDVYFINTELEAERPTSSAGTVIADSACDKRRRWSTTERYAVIRNDSRGYVTFYPLRSHCCCGYCSSAGSSSPGRRLALLASIVVL